MKVRNLSLLCVCAALLCAAPLLAAETHTNSIGMEFVKIPAGSFMRGKPLPDCDPNFDKDCKDKITNEMPQRRISVSGFWLGKYEVTQEQWVAVMGENPSKEENKGRTNPVSDVSWERAQQFIEFLNQKEGHRRYRLPTEAEWEYAARAGSSTEYYFGDDPEQLGDYGWYTDNSKGTVQPVGQLKPNAWGLYDMHGNVAEWVQDQYAHNYYASSPEKDPQGPNNTNTIRRVLRGGCFVTDAKGCRLGARYEDISLMGHHYYGFRLAMEE